MKKLYLKEPTMEEKKEIKEMVEEFFKANDEYPFEGVSNFKKVQTSYEEFLEEVTLNKHIDRIKSDFANQTTYILIDEDGHIYGCANVRHELKGKLYEIGGNVGYAIRPSERHKGYGTLQLRLLLEKMNELGIENALVTCRENNIASKKTMESFIGNSLSLVPSMYEGIMEYRYLIDVKENIKSNNKNK